MLLLLLLFACRGLLKLHFTQPMSFPVGPSGPQTSLNYADFCKLFDDQPGDPNPDPSNANSRAMCRTLRVAGIMCLVMGIVSVLCTAITALYGLFLLARQTTVQSKGVFGWRIAGFANMASIACFCYWIASAHVIVMHNINDANGDIWSTATATATAAADSTVRLRDADHTQMLQRLALIFFPFALVFSLCS